MTEKRTVTAGRSGDHGVIGETKGLEIIRLDNIGCPGRNRNHAEKERRVLGGVHGVHKLYELVTHLARGFVL